MTILIDNRAGSEDLINYPPLDELGELCHLDSGDVCFPGNGPQGGVLVGVEVKSITDLLTSISTGRLQAKQLPAMIETYDVIWILHYGSYRPCPRTGALQIEKGAGRWYDYALGKSPTSYRYLDSQLFDIIEVTRSQTGKAVNVKRVESIKEAAIWLYELHRWWNKSWTGHKGLRTFDNSRAVVRGAEMEKGTWVMAKVAAAFPTLGYERAVAMANHFENVLDMLAAGAKEWAKVPGVGKVVAKELEYWVTWRRGQSKKNGNNGGDRG